MKMSEQAIGGEGPETRLNTIRPRDSAKRHLFDPSAHDGNGGAISSLCGSVSVYGPFEAFDPKVHLSDRMCLRCEEKWHRMEETDDDGDDEVDDQ